MQIGLIPLLFLVLPCNYAGVKSASKCARGKYKCSNGQCIEGYLICDGAKDCQDGTDETQAACIAIQCPEHAFRCAYGACVEQEVKCDGKQDCADNSDELLPECLGSASRPKGFSKCKKNEFSCNSGQCVNGFAKCDGVRDCDDGSDETITQCISLSCPSLSFQCAYGACIELDKKCNGIKDCSDGSDEDDELCEDNVTNGSELLTTTTRRPVDVFGPSRGCWVPQKESGTNYQVYTEECRSHRSLGRCQGESGRWVPEYTPMGYICDPGYALPPYNNLTYCKNGEWSPKEIKCQKMCKALLSEYMVLDCQYQGKPVKCDQPALSGTEVLPKCKPSYHAADSSVTFAEAQCTPEGKWELPLFKCVPDCGKKFNPGNPLIAHGMKTLAGEYPWHAGLYLKKGRKFTHSCGGTIISPRIVLTAAHCVFNNQMNAVLNKKLLKVAVGKYHRSWSVKDRLEQRFGVNEIIVAPFYRGPSNSYAQDIAVLELSSIIELSEAVLPACIDWTKEGNFVVAPLGTVVGWGEDENGNPTEELKVAKLPYLDFETCHRKSPENFHTSITYDKFCAATVNGTSVQHGDSGGGMTFEMHDHYYVYGIVSTKPGDDLFATYTNITTHIEWLYDVARALTARHPSV